MKQTLSILLATLGAFIIVMFYLANNGLWYYVLLGLGTWIFYYLSLYFVDLIKKDNKKRKKK